jgi:DNA polymerase
MGMFHPAAILRNPNQKPEAFADFQTLRDKILQICNHTELVFED